MSEFASEGSQAADEEVAHVRSEPVDDPLTQPGPAAESGGPAARGDRASDDENQRED
ncbi:MAG TPA: hypothetical protein VFP34_00455 [Microlunatus sp.]|nr:hypothetical protein [Microlunatus sp.]